MKFLEKALPVFLLVVIGAFALSPAIVYPEDWRMLAVSGIIGVLILAAIVCFCVEWKVGSPFDNRLTRKQHEFKFRLVNFCFTVEAVATIAVCIGAFVAGVCYFGADVGVPLGGVMLVVNIGAATCVMCQQHDAIKMRQWREEREAGLLLE